MLEHGCSVGSVPRYGFGFAFPGVMNPYPVVQKVLMPPTVSVGKVPAELESLNPDISF